MSTLRMRAKPGTYQLIATAVFGELHKGLPPTKAGPCPVRPLQPLRPRAVGPLESVCAGSGLCPLVTLSLVLSITRSSSA